MTTFESEQSIEDHLIRQLTEQASQWTLRDDLRTIDDLWANFRRILVQNNKVLFDEHPLTDNEFLQVQNHLPSARTLNSSFAFSSTSPVQTLSPALSIATSAPSAQLEPSKLPTMP